MESLLGQFWKSQIISFGCFTTETKEADGIRKRRKLARHYIFEKSKSIDSHDADQRGSIFVVEEIFWFMTLMMIEEKIDKSSLFLTSMILVLGIELFWF